MSSPIRELLADAQAAEVKGDKAEAARLLRKAAALYRDANNHTRALKMLRHARRLEGVDEDGAGEELLADGPIPDPPASPPLPARSRRVLEERTATLAPPALEAWCSFCCKPKREVGTLVAGPAGAFICSSCVQTAEALLTGAPVAAPRAVAAPMPPSFVETRAAIEARKRLEARTGRVTLLVGPEGSGKSAVLAALGDTLRLDESAGPELVSAPPGEVLRIDLLAPVTPQLEHALLSLLERGGRVAIAVRAEPPTPALVLTGASGEEPLYDTRGLAAALGSLLPRSLLESVDGVVVLRAPDAAALEELAVGLVATRGDVVLSEETLKQIAGLAHQSGRGAHELVALLARVPRGQWKGGP